LRSERTANLIAGAAVAILLSAACYLLFTRLIPGSNWDGITANRTLLLQGWLATLAISSSALFISVTLAIGLVAGLRCGLPPVALTCRAYIEIVRGTPLLVQLFLGFYVFADALGLQDRHVAGTILLATFAAAYLAEIFRGGVESIGQSQIQAARAVGFDLHQTYRYVVIPQAVRRVLPATAGQLASLVKDSSLLSVLGISEFTRAAEVINTRTYATFEAYIPVALGYLALTIPISLIAAKLERRFRFET
jgi:polar amino acid transport system permease protein